MDKKEYNRHIRYFIKEFKKYESENHGTLDTALKIQESLKGDFKRLYYADDKAEYITPSLVIKMVCINRILRVIPFHLFYINHEI